MKTLTRAPLFAPATRVRKTRVRKTKEWFERAKLVIAAARDRAVETTARQRAEPSIKRRPTVSQKRRLAEMLRAKS